MTDRPFSQVITSETELRALVGAPSELALKKQLDHINQHAREFIARSPFLLLATSDAQGRCDVSPKGDPAGFVREGLALRLCGGGVDDSRGGDGGGQRAGHGQ